MLKTTEARWRCNLPELFKEYSLFSQCLVVPTNITLKILGRYSKLAMEQKNQLCLELLADLGIIRNKEFDLGDVKSFVKKGEVATFLAQQEAIKEQTYETPTTRS